MSAVLAALLFVAGCGGWGPSPWSSATRWPYRGEALRPPDLTTTVTVGADTTAGARAVLAVRLSRGDRNSLVPEMRNAQSRAGLSIDATNADLSRLDVLRVTPQYSRTDAVPKGSVFDSLIPNGGYTVESGLKGVVVDDISMLPVTGRDVWGYYYPEGGGQISRRRDELAGVLGQRRAEVRLVTNTPIVWWVLRFPDGSEGAVPQLYGGTTYAGGLTLKPNTLYPVRTIFAEVRFGGG